MVAYRMLVLSGFIIPWSMHQSRYGFANMGTFLLKRLARIEPPYILSIVLVLVLGWASMYTPGYKGAAFAPSIPNILAHLGYVNYFTNQPWLQPVYWTLAVEFLFYISMALLFPLLGHQKRHLRLLGMGLLLLLIPLNRYNHFQYGFNLPWFLGGIALFQWRAKLISGWECLALQVGFQLIAHLYIGLDERAAGLIGVLLVAFLNRPIPGLHALGLISFSLYLIHVPVASRAANLLMRLLPADTQPSRLLASLGGLLVAIAASWLFYRIIEKPAQRLSSRIRFGNKPQQTSSS